MTIVAEMTIQERIEIVERDINKYGVGDITIEEYKYLKQQIRSDAIEECIKKLVESEDTILSDWQYYTLMELKEQK